MGASPLVALRGLPGPFPAPGGHREEGRSPHLGGGPEDLQAWRGRAESPPSARGRAFTYLLEARCSAGWSLRRTDGHLRGEAGLRGDGRGRHEGGPSRRRRPWGPGGPSGPGFPGFPPPGGSP